MAMVEKTGRPGYLQIADDLRAQIRGGSLAPGTPLPSTAQLAEQYDASASCATRAW
jgi:DNA-binding GntR family transcriptional regulator